MTTIRRLLDGALLLLPGTLIVYLSFRSGGFFAGEPAIVAFVLAVVLALRLALAPPSLVVPGWPAAVALVALALLAIWTLLSAGWSDAPARALVEFDRVLLYALALALFASLRGSPRGRDTMARGIGVAIVVVASAALASRVAPDAFSGPPAGSPSPERLSYPLSYWNALGLLAAIGIVLCAHLGSGPREPAWARALGAAAIPGLAATVLLTLSRGAVLAAALGLVAYLVAGRPARLPALVLAAGAPTVVAVVATARADLLVSSDPTSAAAVAQGHDLALVLGACVAASALLRLLLMLVEHRLAGFAPLRRLAPPGRLAAASTVRVVVVAAMLGAGALIAVGAPSFADRQYERYVDDSSPRDDGGVARLGDPGSSGRLELWEVALDVFAEHPLRGAGAGTYQLAWEQRRDLGFEAVDGHSLYVETLAELGLPGLLLVVIAVAALLVGLASGVRGPDRHVRAALLASGVAWAAHAGIDWDWEMPAVTLWFFAVAGFAVTGGANAVRPKRPWRIVGCVVVLALAITPVRVALSQRDLDRGVAAFQRGDCDGALDGALSALDRVSARPEPFELLGFCAAQRGNGRVAIRAAEKAIALDPDNWELWYGLALVRGTAGRDPRPPARTALRLNPRGLLTRDAAERFSGELPAGWRRQALSARLPIP